jgi:serine phosphatase RsbU (regulator of sigma subunit)
MDPKESPPPSEFQPKAFYRKFDSLLHKIDRASARDLNILALDELIGSFATDLKLRSGCLYRLKGASYEKVRGPIGSARGSWPAFIPRHDESVVKLIENKTYIYNELPTPPWGKNSVAVVLGEENQFIMAFRLDSGWERELLDLSLNTIRNTINYIRSARRLGAVFQEAYEIQKSLLPTHDPKFDGFDIAGRSMATELVGGDLFDFHLFDKKMMGIAIGDASGHGLPAALLVRDVLTGLRMGVERELKIAGLVEKLNRVINQSSLSSRFVSLIYGELEENGTFVYVNAGHSPPLLFKKTEVQELNVGGTILGPIPDITFRRGFAFMEPGDTMVFFTDGVVEREDLTGDPYGKQRLIEFVGKMKDETAATIVEKLFIELYKFGASEKWRDDATAIVIKRLK